MIRRTGGKSVTLHSNDSLLGFKLTQDEKFWRKQKAVMLKALGNAPQQMMTLGVGQAANLGVDVTFDLVNQTVLDAVDAYTDPWWQQIEQSTRDSLRAAISRNIESGNPLSALIKDLEPVFGPTRANTIATTEVTNLFTQGNNIAYEAAGVAEVEFRSVNDGLVCEDFCQPAVDDNPYELGSAPQPPLHPRCRCFLVPTVEAIEEQERRVLTETEAVQEIPELHDTMVQYQRSYPVAANIRTSAEAVARGDSGASMETEARTLLQAIERTDTQSTPLYRGLRFDSEAKQRAFIDSLGNTVDIPLASTTTKLDQAISYSQHMTSAEPDSPFGVVLHIDSGSPGISAKVGIKDLPASEVVISGRYEVTGIEGNAVYLKPIGRLEVPDGG